MKTMYKLVDLTELHWYQKVYIWCFCLYTELRYKEYARYERVIKHISFRDK